MTVANKKSNKTKTTVKKLKLVTFELEDKTLKEAITETKLKKYLELMSHCGYITRTIYNDNNTVYAEYTSDDFTDALKAAEDIAEEDVKILRKHRMLNRFIADEVDEFVERQKENNEENGVDWDGNPIQTWGYYPIKIARGDDWWYKEAKDEEECKRETAKLIESGKYLKGELAYRLSDSSMKEVIV